MAVLFLHSGGAKADEAEPLCIITKGRNIPVTVEIADSDAERAKGLMGRRSLKASHGMLFRYQSLRPPDSAFWMYQTLIPLDIAWIGPLGDIRSIKTMTPCNKSESGQCHHYKADVYYTQALEMNRGFISDNGIVIGDRVALQKETPCAR